MQTLSNIADLRTLLAQAHSNSNQVIALVPTMGNLHPGHLSLVRLAKERADIVVVSIFVNPSQFGETEDLAQYPRTFTQDQKALATMGVDYLFTPNVEDMYPLGLPMQVTVTVPPLAKIHCGAKRLGHFDGVATVVTRLFNLLKPDIAIFGRKDFQQLKVIEWLTQALGFNIDIVGAPILRTDSGLAMSSRNQYLTHDQQQTAAILYQTLLELKADLLRPEAPWTETRIQSLCDHAQMYLADQGFVPEYLHLCRSSDLQLAQAEDKNQQLILLAAAKLGETRLIDNIEFSDC